MVEKKEVENSLVKDKITTIFLILSVISFIVLMLMTVQVVKMEQQHIFRTTIISDYANGALIDGLNITNDKLSELQSFRVDAAQSIDYTFCFHNIKSSSDPLELRIINKDNIVLGKDYFDNSTTYDCIYLNNSLQRNNLLGVQCKNCNDTKYIVLQEELLGVDVKKIIIDNLTVSSISTGNTNGYVLKQHVNGAYLLILLKNIYFTVLFFFFLIMLIWVGYDGFKNMLTEIEG